MRSEIYVEGEEGVGQKEVGISFLGLPKQNTTNCVA